MSNPAVSELGRTYLNNRKTEVWLDDNIGESVHLHIEDIRIDFTVKGFSAFSEEINDVINELINVPGFDIYKIEPRYFEDMLWENISHLKEVKYDEIMLADILCPADDGRLVYLPDSRLVKALNGDDSKNTLSRNSDHINQNSDERLQDIKEYIDKYEYPHNGQYIILYNDDNIVQDGQHRAACLYVKYGNIPVKIQRFVFDNYKTRSMNRPFEYTFLGEIIGDIKHPMAWLRRKVDYTLKKRTERTKNNKLHKYLAKNKTEYLESINILDNK